MGRNRKTPFASWETTAPGGMERRYIRVADTFFCHPAYKALGDKAARLYLHMRMESGGKREFELPYTKAQRIMPISRPAIQASIAELSDRGFIDKVEHGKSTRTPNLYRFSERWKEDSPKR